MVEEPLANDPQNTQAWKRHTGLSVGIRYGYWNLKKKVITRQNLTYVDVRFWRLKSIPALEELNKL